MNARSLLSVLADLFHDFSDMQIALTFKDVGILASPWKKSVATAEWCQSRVNLNILCCVISLSLFHPAIIYFLADNEIPTLARNKKELLFIFL